MDENHKKHNDLLDEIVSEFRSKGYRVIVLGRKPILDAIAIKDDSIVGIECTSSILDSKLYTKKLKYQKYGFETDDLIIIANNIPSIFKVPAEAYYYAIELRKKGYKYKDVSKQLLEKFQTSVSASMICHWSRGYSKPLSVRNLEGIHRKNFKI